MGSFIPRPLRAVLGFVTIIVIVLSSSFSATGCADDHAPASQNPAVVPDAGPGTTPDVAPNGVLRVRIAGLPAGTSARVVVTGPNELEKKVSVDTDLPLPPGTYDVRAAAVGDGTVPNADGYRPKAVIQSVTIAPGAGQIAHVEYEKVATKISADAKMVDAQTAAAITNLTRDASGNATLTLGSATTQSMSWKAGDIVVVGQTAATPGGFFGRVVSSDGKTIVTSPATMQDVVEEGVFVFSRSFGSEDVKGVTALDSGVSAATVCNTLSASLPASKGAASLALTTTGNLCFTADMNLSLSFSGKLLPDVYFRADAGITSSLTVEGAATIGIGIEIPIFDIDLGHYTIWTGAIPWVITPELAIVIGANGEVTAGVRAGFTASASAYGGFTYDSHSKAFSPFSGKSTSFGVIWPEPFATATVKGYGGPQLTLLVDEVAGPFVSLQGYVQFDVDFLNNPLWQLHAGIDLSGGLATSKLLDFQYSVPLFNYDKVIAQSTDTPPVGAKVGTQKTSPSDQGIAVGPDDTFYVATGNSVRAHKTLGAPLWTYTGTGFMEDVVRGPDGVIYADDFDGVVYALNATGTEKWKIPAVAGGHGISLSGTTLYLATTHSVVALSTTDGAQLWQAELGAQVWKTAIAKDGYVYANTTAALAKLDPTANGNVVWSTPLGTVTGGVAIAADGTLYTTIFDGPVKVVAVRPDGTVKWSKAALYADSVSAPSVGPDGAIYLCGTFPDPSVVSLEPVSGTKRWGYRQNENCTAAPTISNDGKVYAVNEKSLRAFSAADGSVLFAQSTAAGSSPRGSPNFLSTGDVVAANQGGVVVIHAGGGLATSGWPRGGFDASGASRAK